MRKKPSERDFAYAAMADYRLYLGLARVEKESDFKKALLELAAVSKERFSSWARKSGVREDEIEPFALRIFWYVLLRRMLGLMLTVRYVSGKKSERVARYTTYCTTCTDPSDHKKISGMADRMEAAISTIKEERVVFFSSIVLGFNDALIELTGALVGFSFALKDASLITVGGLITGVSASMSMAASAYLQARHEKGKNPLKAALFTGGTYLLVALVLVAPFLFISSTVWALGVMFSTVFVLIALVSFYSALLLQKRYIVQFLEMFLLSLGVAAVGFVIGQSIALI